MDGTPDNPLIVRIHIFTREGVEEIVNVQPKGGNAKPYQVRQVITKYKLSGQVHDEA